MQVSACWVILQPCIELRGITFQGLGLVKVSFQPRFVGWFFVFFLKHKLSQVPWGATSAFQSVHHRAWLAMSGLVCGNTGKPETGDGCWRLNLQTWDTAGLLSPAFGISFGKISVVHVDSELFLSLSWLFLLNGVKACVLLRREGKEMHIVSNCLKCIIWGDCCLDVKWVKALGKTTERFQNSWTNSYPTPCLLKCCCSVLQGEEASHIAERNDTKRSPALFFWQCCTSDAYSVLGSVSAAPVSGQIAGLAQIMCNFWSALLRLGDTAWIN